jgi:phosphate transport system substrate-binding protein
MGGLLLCGTLLWGAVFHAAAQQLRVGGTGSALGTMQLLMGPFAKADPERNAATIVPNLGSSGALRALHAGAIDMAVIGRPLKPEEAAAGLVGFEYGRAPFVFVSSKPAVKNITAAAVADALSGRVIAWPDGEPLRFVMRPENDGDNTYLASFSPDIAAALKVAHKRIGLVMATTDQDAADLSERLSGSLAVNTLALILSERRKLNVLAFNGVAPSVKALADGSYPYFKPLLMVTRGAPAGAAERFITLARSAQGRAILEANGHLVSH